MRPRWGIAVVLLAATLAGPAAATHDARTIPLASGDEPVDDALAWADDQLVRPEGCVDGDPCSTHWTKWYAVTAAHVGLDPEAWPSQDASVGGWLLDHADDLRDERLRSCQRDPDRSEADCADDRVFSHAKSILAFRAAGREPRSIPLPDGGDRDLVAELLDEHGGSQFGRPQQANDDVWALIALNSVGYEGAAVEDAVARIEDAQRPDGGVAYSTTGTTTVDVTASAVMAVAPHDRPSFLEAARDYLADQQVAEGDRPGCWRVGSAVSSAPNAESTARAVHALAALGEDPIAWSVQGQSPIECLLSFQRDGGGFYHAEGGRVHRMPTQQALAALAWRPYGSVREPASTLEVTDEATAGEEHTATVPGGRLRVNATAVGEHAWTPEETGRRVFHGFTTDPVRPVELVVHVTEDEATGSGGDADEEDASSDGSDADETGREPSQAPEAALAAPARAERNVTATVRVNGTPGDAPVTAFRLEGPDGNRTGWRPTGTFEVTLHRLGNATIRAWARDADGRVSDPASARLEIVDARPRLSIDGPALVNRTEPARFAANASDPDGPAPNVTWRVGDDAATGLEARLSLDEPGLHTVRARAVDRAGNTADATLEVRARNRAPANVTVTPRTLEANATEVLHARARDPDGDELSVAWRPAGADRPTSWGAQLHLDTGPPGNRTLHVNVSDRHGAWTSANVTVAIRENPDEAEREPRNATTRSSEAAAEPPARPAEPAEPARVRLASTVTATANRSRLLHGTAHSPGGEIVNVTVALGGPVPVRGADNFTALLPGLPAGEYDLAARAADLRGWGPWTNATLVVEPAPDEEGLRSADAGAASEEPSPIPAGPWAGLGLALAAVGRRYA